MMQPMFPEGDWKVDKLKGGGADGVVVEVEAGVVAAAVELEVATDEPVVSGAVTVTVLDEPPHPASATANATTAPGSALFTQRSLADTPEWVGSLYEHDHHSR